MSNASRRRTVTSLVVLSALLLLAPFAIRRLRATEGGEAPAPPDLRSTLALAQDLASRYDGLPADVLPLESGSARPTALAAGDFDGDGVPDLVTGFASAPGGVVTLHRGNADAIYPETAEARQRRRDGTFLSSPFAPEASVHALPLAPDFLGTGDFDNDGRLDVVAAARSGRSLVLLSGDGRGGFREPRQIDLGGAVTAMTVADVNRADGLADVLVAVSGGRGAELLVFESPEGALAWDPERIVLPADATGIATGAFGDSGFVDIACAAGNGVVLVRGRDRQLSVHPKGQAPRTVPVVDLLDLPYGVESVTAGSFAGHAGLTLALLDHEGWVHFLTADLLKDGNAGRSRQIAPADETVAPVKALTRGQADGVPRPLAAARLAGAPGSTIVAFDPAQSSLRLVRPRGPSSAAASTAFAPGSEGTPVALLPLRLSPAAGDGLVVLRTGAANPLAVVPQAVNATFVVNSTNDVDDGVCDATHCSLREAINAANAAAGLDTISFSGLASGNQTITPTSALPVVTSPVILDGTTHPDGRVEINGGLLPANTNGLVVNAGGSTIRGMVINRFGGNGYGLLLQSAGNDVVEGCYLGLNLPGTSGLANGYGVFLNNVTGITIGGTTAAARNVVSGNGNYGIYVSGGGAPGNAVLGNYVGTNAAGAAAVANSFGIAAFSSTATIGGTAASARNVVSGNSNYGLYLGGLGAGSLVQGNYIGTNAAGTARIPNNLGIYIYGGGTVGGTAAGAANVVSGNNGDGVNVGSAPAIQVQGNLIGTDPTGSTALANNGSGVSAGSSSHVIGGVGAARNVISGNSGMGVYLSGASSVTVKGNLIGTKSDGTTALGNNYGVYLNSANGNTIGGAAAGEANTIAFNSKGVSIGSGTGNSVQRNTFFGNTSIGIDLGNDGPTPNDAGDPDGGPNNLQNFPAMTSATIDGGGNLIVIYAVDTLPVNATYPLTVDFFKAASTSSAQGKSWIGSDSYSNTDFAAGPKTVNLGNAASLGIAGLSPLVSTATDAGGNTSEFSPVKGVTVGVTNWVVNSTNDVDDGVCDATHCSLREAINAANVNNPILDTISFNIPGGGPYTIVPTSPLPAITDAVILDGTTQPGYAGTPIIELNGTSAGGGATGLSITSGGTTVKGLVINRFNGWGIALATAGGDTLAGNYVGTNVAGTTALPNGGGAIWINNAGTNTIGGTTTAARNVIVPADYGHGVYLTGGSATGNVIVGNYTGLNATGTSALGNGYYGIHVQSPGNTIGGTAAGAGNVVGRANQFGIWVDGATASGNVVQGNLIGTNAAGTAASGASYGVLIDGAPNNTIGGSGAARNLISGCNYGIFINGAGATGNSVKGNLIGTKIDGTTALGNSYGVYVNGAGSNTIGGTGAGEGNTIAFNSKGVTVVGTAAANAIRRNVMFGNTSIAIDLGDNGPTPNDAGDPDSGPNNLQNFPVMTSATIDGSGNLIVTYGVDTATANAGYPLTVDLYLAASSSSAQGKTWFTSDTWTASDFAAGSKTANLGNAAALGVGALSPLVATVTDAAGNTSEFSSVRGVTVGVTNWVVNSTNDVDDGVCDATHCSLREAINASNANAPVLDTISFNIPGGGPYTIVPTSPLPAITDAVILDGTTQPGFAGTPLIELNGTSAGGTGLNITAGGTTVKGLVVNRFNGWGIALATAGGDTLAGNYVGTNVAGTTALPNSGGAIYVNNVGSNTIGGTTAAARNVIVPADYGHGIYVAGANATGNTIQGNYIGLDSSGGSGLGTGYFGIYLESPGNAIGGIAAGAGNVFGRMYSSGYEIYLQGASASGNSIQGNLVGTNAAGTTGFGGAYGIFLDNAPNNTIGGSGTARNLVSGKSYGITIQNSGATGNSVKGNLIGTKIDGTTALGNSYGVYINGAGSNTIGGAGAGEGNTIAFNSKGITVVGSATANAIRRNVMFGNTSIAIDLGDNGATPNDAGDPDSGPNNLQNFPVMTSATIDGSGNLIVTYGVDTATANASYPLTVDFFVSGSASSAQGRTWFAADTWTASDFTAGSKIVNLGNAAALGVGAVAPLVATATDAAGNTSEFSAVKGVTVGIATWVVNSTNDLDDGSCDLIHCSLREAINAANLNAPFLDTISFAIPGSGPYTITPTSPLPTITDAVILDGTTQPGYAGTPLIELNGTTAGGDGLSITAGGSTVKGLVINRFGGWGISISGAGGDTIAGNYIGTNLAGTASLPNSGGAIYVNNVGTNSIGGTTAAARNVIVPASYGYGVYVAGASATGNAIQGNFVGLDATGAAGLGNGYYGIFVTSAGNNSIGGTAAGAGNVIGNASQRGVCLQGAGATGNSVQGNLIGTNAAGTSGFGGSYGVFVDNAPNNTIGGSGTARNLISGSYMGVYIQGAGATGNTVKGNLIGTQIDGTSALGNTYGVYISGGGSNTIGGTGAGDGNTIAFNSRGVAVPSGTGNAITRNAFFGNGYIGIDLGDNGPTPNDAGDPDGGANNLQNFPVITLATVDGSGNLLVTYGVDTATGNGAYPITVEFFRSADGATNQGRAWIGSDAWSASDFVAGSKVANLGNAAALGIGPGTPLVATATDSGGNTSEFSAIRTVNAGPSTFVVNTTSDTDDGICDALHCSLREAINLANGNTPALDTIQFAIPGSGVRTIVLTSPLPHVTDGVVIDGTTQPGYSGMPLIELNGTNAGSDGLYFASGASTVKALVVNRFPGSGIVLASDGSSVQSSFIGTDFNGTLASPNGSYGIRILSGSNSIGGAGALANLISGNSGSGIYLSGGAATGNTIEGNRIGTDATGTAALGNGNQGVELSGAPGNTIGGTASGHGNLVSANTNGGIAIYGAAAGNLVLGNRIGTKQDGSASLGTQANGVVLGASGNTVGGTASGAGNQISGNAGDGIQVSASGNVIQGNLIGTDAAGALAVGNTGNGVEILADGATVGGASPSARNVISGSGKNGILVGSGNSQVLQGNFVGTNAAGTGALGNTLHGVRIANSTGTGVSGNVISGNGAGILVEGTASGTAVAANLVGTDATGTTALANAGHGVEVAGAPQTVVGGTTPAARNVISGNIGRGVRIAGASAAGSTVEGNYIGTDVTGLVALGNTSDGVEVSDVSNVTVGGTAPGAGNLVSGNGLRGIVVSGGSTGNRVQGNWVGVDATGAARLANAGTGVELTSSPNNVVGGTASGARNVVSGNGALGVYLNGSGASGNLVQGNFVGTNAAGNAPIGNGSSGIDISSAPGNTIGGTASGARNVISGNGGIGVSISFSGAATNQIVGNYIGTDVTGLLALGNGADGISIFAAPGNTIGGTAAGAGNVISSNGLNGIIVSFSGSAGNTIRGNLIGTGADGTAALGNAFSGVQITGGASNNTIGGTGANAPNVIAHNGANGIAADSGTGNLFSANSVFSDGLLGIDLGPAGVTPNDPMDTDIGANGLQNFPVITSAVICNGNLNVSGTLNSLPGHTFTIELFATNGCSAAGYGEGRSYLGSAGVSTDGSGNAAFSFTLPPTVPAGSVVTATASLAGRDTSEFSACVTVTTDVTPPVVTPPAGLALDQTVCCGTFGGATGASMASLAAFIAGGSATDNCTASPTRLAPQVGGVDVDDAFCFPAGSTTVTFRYQDAAGNTGTANATVTVSMFGDLNADGTIDATDVVILRSYLNLAISPGTPPFNAALNIADVSHDSNVDSSDVVILRGYLNLAVTCLAP